MRFEPAKLTGGQRLLFLGQTGSGKSVLARFLLKLARKRGWRIVIIDPKKDWMIYMNKKYKFATKGLGTVDSPWLVTEFDKRLAVQIIQPHRWNPDIAKFLRDVIAEKNTIVYIDEIAQLASATVVPDEINIIWTQGRSIRVGGWCATQRPKRIPVVVKDQSEIWFMFRVNSRDDRKITEGYLPLEEEPRVVAHALPKRWFWYWEDSMTRPLLIRPLDLKEGKAA